MATRKIAIAAAVLALTSSLAHAQQSAPPQKTAPPSTSQSMNVTGSWNGTIKPVGDDSAREETGLLVLKQDGAVVTGTAGPNVSQQWAIAKGKIATTKDGTVLTFEVSNDSMVMQFEMKLVGDQLKGDAKAERNGEKKSAAVQFTRAK